MKSPHPTATDFEHYILGALGPEAAARLEAHTLECPVCARRLHQEALLEERLREVARAPRGATVLRPARWHAVRKAAVLVGGLAAAALALLMAPPPGAPSPVLPPLEDGFPEMAPVRGSPGTAARLVACPDLASQETCAAEALARGLWVEYPRGLGEVPRYEGSAGRASHLLASSPSPL
jgi:anti-sigma factor RsiW